MAVFYKWIKGCTEDANLGSGNWSYIKWTSGLPQLYVTTSGKSDDLSGARDFGTLISTNVGSDVTVNDNWNFNGALVKAKAVYLDSIQSNNTSPIQIQSPVDFNEKATFKNNAQFDQVVEFKNEVKITSSIEMTSTAPIKSTASITAPYFVATSDVRAKDNVELWNYTALDLVNATPVYSFNYKSDHDRVVSILAQDLLENQPENLDLVNDKDADGINKFMSIKSDKLTFVLWKAVQELSDKVDRLEKELEEIKHSK